MAPTSPDALAGSPPDGETSWSAAGSRGGVAGRPQGKTPESETGFCDQFLTRRCPRVTGGTSVQCQDQSGLRV